MKNTTQIFILFLVYACFYQIYGQKGESHLLKINNFKPSVYVAYDHKGKSDPLFEGESTDRIWLRLHNNTKLNLFLCVFDVDEEYGNKGVFYDVQKISPFKDNQQASLGYGRADSCEVFTLQTGKNLLFSLPNEHIAKGLFIKIQFHYGWTGNWKDDMYEGTNNFVVFGNSQLPK